MSLPIDLNISDALSSGRRTGAAEYHEWNSVRTAQFPTSADIRHVRYETHMRLEGDASVIVAEWCGGTGTCWIMTPEQARAKAEELNANYRRNMATE